jgi:hypothetical protein
MSTTYPIADQTAASSHPHVRQAPDGGAEQQPGGSPSYVGVHRRRDGQGRNLDDAPRRPRHRGRHRRGR